MLIIELSSKVSDNNVKNYRCKYRAPRRRRPIICTPGENDAAQAAVF